MTNFVKAIYHPKIKAAEFITDDGKHCIRSGGSLPWRIFNYGDLVSPVSNGIPSPKKTKGFIGFANPEDSELNFFIFPSYEIARRELKASLQRKHGEKTLAAMVTKYAPPKDNDTEKYIKNLSAMSGVDRDKKIKDLNNQQLEAVMDGIGRIEGYEANASTRKELWIDVSHIQATDGTRPVAEQELVVRGKGPDRVIKSNAVGQFPPIVHEESALSIFKKTVTGELEKIGELLPNEPQRLNFYSKVSEYVGLTAPVKPPEPAKSIEARRQPVRYIVKPNDQLGILAKKFGTTAAQITKDNLLTKSTIYPGQVLMINGNSTAVMPSLPSQKAVKVKPKHATAAATGATTAATPAKTAAPPQAPRVVREEERTVPARSKEGDGPPLALISTNERVAPWMQFAIAEAKRFKGATEDVIEKDINYHVEIHDGRKSLVGSDDAWCAAFVNWCLMKAGYPIENAKTTGFVDYKAAVARADGFIHLHGLKAKGQKYDDVPLVANPLYYVIDKPVYGAIAIVTNSSGHGHHAALVYGKIDENNVCILGGNQSQMIRVDWQNIKEVPAVIKMAKVNGKMVKKVVKKAMRDHLVFLLPVAYKNPSTNTYENLPVVDPAKINVLLGIGSGPVTHSDR